MTANPSAAPSRSLAWVLPVIAVLAPCSVAAQVESPGDTIVVTATRSELPLRDATVPVTIIDREQIELSMATDLAELLRFEAGIDIGRNGGPGQATSVFMRGTESNHTLVLIDGVRINPGTIGGAAVQHIDPRAIERVEIVKGSRSALFGTDAIGGVINIITRRASTPYLDVGAGTGSFGQRAGYLSGGVAGDAGELGLTLNLARTDGFPIRDGNDVDRGYENLSGNVYAKRRFDFGELSLRHWRAGGNVEYLDFFLTPLDQDYRNESTALELVNDFAAAGRSQLIVSRSLDRILQNQSSDNVESSRLSLDWQYSLALGEHDLAAGLFLADERAESVSQFGSGFDEDTRYRAVFMRDSIKVGRHRAFVAARYTDYDSFGAELTWNAEYGIDIAERWQLSAGLGHAFRAPDATDRFGFGGNPDLRPEIADEAQLGLTFNAGDRQRLTLQLYANDIDDLIEFDLATFTVQNIASAEIRGVELGYEFKGERWMLRANGVSQRAENAADGSRLLRRADESLTLSVSRQVGNGDNRLGLSALWSGDRADFGLRLPAYALVNLTSEVRLGRRWQVNARIENLFDEAYETAAGFRMQGRSGFVELSYRYR